MRRVLLAFGIGALFALPACKQSPKEARRELATLNVPFTAEEFVMRCMRGPTTLVDTFLAAGADPNVVVGEGRETFTPLMAAAEDGRVDIAKQLLKAGAKPDFHTDAGRSALDIAAENCTKPDMVKFLLDRGARPGEQSLFLAIAHSGRRQSECSQANLAYLLGGGADVNQRNKQGITPLMFAADRNDLDAVRFILRHKPRLDLQGGPYNWSALQYAVKYAMNDGRPSSLPIIKELLRAGANPNLRDRSGESTLAGVPPFMKQLDPIREALIAAGAQR